MSDIYRPLFIEVDIPPTPPVVSAMKIASPIHLAIFKVIRMMAQMRGTPSVIIGVSEADDRSLVVTVNNCTERLSYALLNAVLADHKPSLYILRNKLWNMLDE